MLKYIITILFIITTISAFGKEYTESPFSIISDIIRAQAEKEAKIKNEELEKLKEKKKKDEITEKEAKEIEKNMKKRLEKERKLAEAERKRKEEEKESEKREKRKNKFILKLNSMYPNSIQLPMYSISRSANYEAGAEFEYNRKITKRVDLGAGIIYSSGISGKDSKGWYRGPDFSIIPVYGVAKYKTKYDVKGYRLFIRGVAGYPIVFMKKAASSELSGVVYLGAGAGIDNSKYLFEISYETSVMNVEIIDIEADSSRLMLKAGYIF
jgi:hypothetical protein